MTIGEVCLLTNDVPLMTFIRNTARNRLGARIIEPPAERPLGAVNMSFQNDRIIKTICGAARLNNRRDIP